jgi:colanic acid/amylovoran biosynthesis protein
VRVLITNTHSALNSGDLAITLAEIQLLKRNLGCDTVTLTSRTPAIDNEFIAPLGGRLLPPLVPAPSVFDGTVKKALCTAKDCVAIQSKVALIRAMKRCDLVVGSGGGYFWSSRRRFLGPMFLQNYLHLRLPCLLRKPVVLFPQSFGPFYNPTVARLLKGLLNHRSIVKVFARENLSYEFALGLLEEQNRNKIDVCPDVTFCLERSDEQEPPAALDLPKPLIGVTVRQWDFPNLPTRREKKHKQFEYLDALAHACGSIYRQWHGSVLVFAQARGPGAFEDDSAISNKLAKRLKEIIPSDRVVQIDVARAVSPFRLIHLLSHADLLIATRFHSAIFAFLAGVPAISIAYQPKSTGIMNSLGLDRYSLDISALNPDTISELAGEILTNYPETRANLVERVKHLRIAATKKLETALATLSTRDNHESPPSQ